MSKALVIIDVNNFFLRDAPKDFAKRVASHIKSADYDVLTFTVFKNTPDSNFVKSLNWTKCSSQEDALLPPELQEFTDNKNIFEKSTYSGFSGTKLHEYLKSKQVNELTLCGIDTDACVLATAFSAFDLGYIVDVNFDLTCSTNDLDEHAQAIIRQSILPRDKQEE